MNDYQDPLDEFATKVEVDDNVDPEFLGDPNAVVRAKADDARKALPVKNRRLTAEVQEFVRKRMESTDYKLPLPPYDEILHDGGHWAVLKDCLDIVERYRQNGFDANMASVSTDLTRLWGNLAHLGGVVGYLSASVDHAEASRKLSRSKAYLATKEARDELGIHLTDTDASEMSRLQTQSLDKNKQYLNLLAGTLRGSFYAIRSFAEELSRIAHRSTRTEYQGAQHA